MMEPPLSVRIYEDGLANQLFNRYLDRSGDYGALAALALFQSCRAAIRAKVATARLRDQTSREAGLTATEARDYLELALRYLQPGTPQLIAVGGLSGSGKTTLALNLAPHVGARPGAVVLRSDVLRKQMFGVDLEARLPQQAYQAKVTEAVYSRMLELADQALAAGYSVVADAVSLRPKQRQALDKLAQDHDIPFTGLWLQVSRDVQEARVGGRLGDASDATLEVARRQRLLSTGALNWLRIDGETVEDEVLHRALSLIAKDGSADRC